MILIALTQLMSRVDRVATRGGEREWWGPCGCRRWHSTRCLPRETSSRQPQGIVATRASQGSSMTTARASPLPFPTPCRYARRTLSGLSPTTARAAPVPFPAPCRYARQIDEAIHLLDEVEQSSVRHSSLCCII
jgi:hypothetical protein